MLNFKVQKLLIAVPGKKKKKYIILMISFSKLQVLKINI